MKKQYKIYLEDEDYKKLLFKSYSLGFSGRGSISHFLEKVAREPVFFADQNLKAFLELINFNSTAKNKKPETVPKS